MSQEILEHKQKDIKNNWVNSSRFLFYLQVFCILAFVLGGCYRMYNQRYKGKPKVEVPVSYTHLDVYKRQNERNTLLGLYTKSNGNIYLVPTGWSRKSRLKWRKCMFSIDAR